MRVFVSTDFTGRWPVGTAAVVVATSMHEAASLIEAELKNAGLKWDGTLREICTDFPKATVLLDGDY